MKSPVSQLVVALSIFVIFATGYGAAQYMLSRENVRLADLQSQTAVMTGSISSASAARTILVDIAGDEENVQSYFVPENDVVPFINNLESSGVGSATVTVKSVSPGTDNKQATLLVTLGLAGSFDEIMRTIGVLEHLPYAITISTLSVRKDDTEAMWRADVGLVVGALSSQTQ